MTLSEINFNDVEALTRQLSRQKIIPTRFSLAISESAASNAIYAAYKVEVAYRRHEVVLDADTRTHIQAAARWIIDSHGKSGLMLMGLCGNGKTTLMRAIVRLIEYLSEQVDGYSRRKRVLITSAKAITRICTTDHKQYEGLMTEPMLAIDDLGTEPSEVMYYGQPLTPLVDLLSERYDRQLLTLITTNLVKDQLMEHYGERIYDRFKESMQIIPFTNSSYR